jgi:hypothetical protein
MGDLKDVRLMNFLKRLFQRPGKQHQGMNVMGQADKVGHLLDSATSDLFIRFRDTLLREDATYIVPAVWGAMKNCELDKIQREMNREITPAVEQVLHTLGIGYLDEPGQMALQYVVRGYAVWKIGYMIQSFQGFSEKEVQGEAYLSALKELQPWGSA